MRKRIAVLPGDGIGQEVADGAVKVLKAIAKRFEHSFEFETALIGGSALDEVGSPLPDETITVCRGSDAILLGAVGGPKWDQQPPNLRPEKGLLGIRKAFELFANLRPVTAVSSLADSSTLKREVIDNVDLLIVRELTGGIYFGQPSERQGENGEMAVDTLTYHRKEIERIVEKAFECAMVRRKKLTSVDKANVLESSRMWREIVNEQSKKYPEVDVEHMLVDAAAMELIRNPRQFDVMVTENMFGDILSDEASMLTGSLGMLPSASLTSSGFGLYEPVHGSAPDIAGQNKANPLAMVLSAAMMLRYSFQLEEEAQLIERAVSEVLNSGYRTFDLAEDENKVLGTKEMIGQLVRQIEEDNVTAGIMAAYS
jgi:3-isopropylmalate dehydrogenase